MERERMAIASYRNKRRAGLVVCCLLGLALTAGCASSHIHRLTDHKYPATPKDIEIETFYGKVTRPHERIAVIDTSAHVSDDEKTRTRMLSQLRQKARKLGADAIEEITLLTRSGRGWVSDPATPFPSLKQGPYEQNFLRGVAIKFIDPSVDLSALRSPKPDTER